MINVCPWSRLDGAGHCSWRAGKHCRPTHLHPRDLLDHLQRDHGADPAQRDQAMAMLAGVMPGDQAGPFASAQEVQNACHAHECPSCGGARSVAVGGTSWGGWVCGDGFYGEHGDKCVERRSRGIHRYICRIQADGGHIKR